ncbi:MAG: DUF885 domain-containing protein [Balneolaceae bacterium]|nr:DUF885 domain-containing protein [Balneolaceae bacterium]
MVKLLLIFALLSSTVQTADERLQLLFDDHWEYSLQTNPLFATGQGDHRFNDRLPETSLEALDVRHHDTLRFLSLMDNIAREELSEENRIHYDIFKIQLENSLRAYENNDHLLPLNGWWDYHATFADLGNRVPLNNHRDYENYLARLEAFPEYNSGYLERMQKGIELGFVRPKAVFDDYLASVAAHVVDDASDSRLFEPFKNFPASIDDEQREKLRERAQSVIGSIVIPEFEKLHNFLRDEYIPAATETIGITEVPGGDKYYQYLVEMYTTMEITPEEIHQTGLDEVARILAEMMEIVEESGFGEDFDSFVEFLRTDPQFYAETPEELMKETAYVLKMMDGKLPQLFKTLPRLPYGIMEIPDYLAPRTATAYYSRGSADGTRAGFYAVNTYDLPSRPLYEVVAL